MHYFPYTDGRNNTLQGLYNRVWQKLGINYLLVTLTFLYLVWKNAYEDSREVKQRLSKLGEETSQAFKYWVDFILELLLHTSVAALAHLSVELGFTFTEEFFFYSKGVCNQKSWS